MRIFLTDGFGSDKRQRFCVCASIIFAIKSHLTDYSLDNRVILRNMKFKNEFEEDGFSFINSVIENDLKNISKEDTAKIIGTVYRSIKRHNSGKREYLDFIQQHVGLRVGPGIRAIKNYKLTKTTPSP